MLSSIVHPIPKQPHGRVEVSSICSAYDQSIYLMIVDSPTPDPKSYPYAPYYHLCRLLPRDQALPTQQRIETLTLPFSLLNFSSPLLLSYAPQHAGWFLAAASDSTITLALFGFPHLDAPSNPSGTAPLLTPFQRSSEGWVFGRGLFTHLGQKTCLQSSFSHDLITLSFLQFAYDEISDATLFLLQWHPAQPHRPPQLLTLALFDDVSVLHLPPDLLLSAGIRRFLEPGPASLERRGPGLWRLGLETFSLSSGQLLSSFWPDHLSLPIRSLSFPSDDLLDHYLPSLSLASGPSDPNGSPSYFAALSLPLLAPSRPHDHLSRPAVPPQGVGSLFWLSSSLHPLSSLPWLGAFPSLVPSGPSLFGSDLSLDSWRLWRWLPSSPSPSSFLLLDSFPADPSSFFSLLAPSSSSSPSSHPPSLFWSLLASPHQLLLSLRRSSDGSLLASLSLPHLRPPFPNPRVLPALALTDPDGSPRLVLLASDPNGSLSLVEVFPS